MPAELTPIAGQVGTETKPGPKTTEFWVTILIQAVGLANLAFPIYHISDKVALGAMTISGAAYSVARGLSKQGVAYTGE